MNADQTGDVPANSVYNGIILNLAATISRVGILDCPTATATARSRLCGSSVTVYLRCEGDSVVDFAHQVKACALGQATSSVMAANIIGSHATELREVKETMVQMLKHNGSPPAGRWGVLSAFQPVRSYRARHASTLLTFDAVVEALDSADLPQTIGANEAGSGST